MAAGLNGYQNSALDDVSGGVGLGAQINGVSVDAFEYDMKTGETAGKSDDLQDA